MSPDRPNFSNKSTRNLEKTQKIRVLGGWVPLGRILGAIVASRVGKVSQKWVFPPAPFSIFGDFWDSKITTKSCFFQTSFFYKKNMFFWKSCSRLRKIKVFGRSGSIFEVPVTGRSRKSRCAGASGKPLFGWFWVIFGGPKLLKNHVFLEPRFFMKQKHDFLKIMLSPK